MEILFNFIKINWVEIIGAVFGLLYLYYEYKANLKMWPAGIIMSSFYTFVFIQATFYAFACINIYYILAGIYGWIKWYKPIDNTLEKKNTDIGLKHAPLRLVIPLFATFIIVFAIIVYVLQAYTDSHVIYGDSFVTTISIIAMWMLAQKYVEQWLLLIVINIVSIFLYLYQELYPTSIMYLIYSIVSVFGYIKWRRMIIK